MSTVTATTENFEGLVENNDIVIVDFWAEWCGPCKAFAPVFEEASQRHTDVVFAKVDTEAQPQLAGGFAVRAIPTLMVFRQQVLLFAEAGMVPGEALDELIAQAKALDMTKVHAEIAEERAKEDAGRKA